MLWVFDLRSVSHNISSWTQKEKKRIFIYRFHWPWARISNLSCTKPVLLHLGKNQLYNVYEFNYGYGYCHSLSKDQFLYVAGHPDSKLIRGAKVFPLNYEPKRVCERAMLLSERTILLSRNKEPEWRDGPNDTRLKPEDPF